MGLLDLLVEISLLLLLEVGDRDPLFERQEVDRQLRVLYLVFDGELPRQICSCYKIVSLRLI